MPKPKSVRVSGLPFRNTWGMAYSDTAFWIHAHNASLAGVSAAEPSAGAPPVQVSAFAQPVTQIRIWTSLTSARRHSRRNWHPVVLATLEPKGPSSLAVAPVQPRMNPFPHFSALTQW